MAAVLGPARRRPTVSVPGVEWATVDSSRSDCPHPLDQHLASADVVIHLAWFQPTHDQW
ncbi:hypothetical protein ACF1BU_31225 [Streptomyces sp. NPDC014724]|uniref:hypothetical protein n=1 Tax=Streptomyces sp. NPDC014724 TaxID=3364882 RepID=UPI0036F7C269